jgi:hypothetical protein
MLCCCCLCRRALACAAVAGRVEDSGVRGCKVVSGVPVSVREFIPVHRSYVCYSVRYLRRCFMCLDGSVVG